MSEKRVVLTANYSVIEPLSALHLGGLCRDSGVAWTFLPVKKYDFEPLFRRVEEFGATDVGFNVYSGNHQQVYRAADKLRAQGITVHIGGPHATYFATESAGHADWVYKGQSFDSFGAYLEGRLPEFVKESLMLSFLKIRLPNALASYKKKSGIPQNVAVSSEQVDALELCAKAEIEALLETPEQKARIAAILRSRILFRDQLSNTFPKPDRATFYRDNEDMRMNPIKNSICGEGCPFACTYCYNVAWNSDDMYGRFADRVLRPIDEVIEELAELKNFDTELIYFQDDVFGFEKDWIREFMPKYAEKVGIPFHAQLRLELTNGELGKERLKLMKNAGCTGVTVAIENGDYRVRKEILDRAMKDREIFNGCRNIHDAGLTLRTEQILGIPGPDTKPGGNTLDYDLKTLRVNCLIGPTISWVSILAPYGGTALGKKCVELGLYDAERLRTNDDVNDSFFESSVLNYSQEFKDQIRMLQRFFSTFAHHERGHEIADAFLKKRLSRFSHKTIEDFLVPAKEIAKLTKVTLYDNELYKTQDKKALAVVGSFESCRPGVSGTNTKSADELLANRDSPQLTLEQISQLPWGSEQQEVFSLMEPLWKHVPRGDLVAQQFLETFPSYTAQQREAFLSIGKELALVVEEIDKRGPLDRDAEIRRLIDEETARFKREREQETPFVVSQQEVDSSQ